MFPEQQAPCLCANNQREQGLQGFLFFPCLLSFSMAILCCLVLGCFMPGNSSGRIIFSTHSSILTQRSILCADREGDGLLPSLTKEASVQTWTPFQTKERTGKNALSIRLHEGLARDTTSLASINGHCSVCCVQYGLESISLKVFLGKEVLRDTQEKRF